MRMNTQRILAALLSLVLLLALAPAGWAEEGGEGGGDMGAGGDAPVVSASMPATGVNLDPEANTVIINLAPSDKGAEFASDIVNAKIQADLYLVAPAAKDDNYDTYTYTFPTGPIQIDDVNDFNKAIIADPENPNDQATMLNKFTGLAHKIADEILKADTMTLKVYSSEPVESTSITVEKLDPGLYILILRGYGLERKLADSETDKDKCYVTEMTKLDASGNPIDTFTATRAFSDAHEFIFEPQMITVPTKVVYDSDNKPVQQYNTAYGEWTNTLNIVAKPDWKPRYGDLKIVKTLADYIGTDPATFVYKITAETVEGNERKVVFSDVAAINYPNETEVTVKKQIPIGASITVEEVYEGSRYEAVGEITQTTSILTPSIPASVEFTNKHNNTDTGGYGVINKSTFHEDKTDPSNGEWDYVTIDPVHTTNSNSNS